jgi:hypothetical protein
MANKSQLESKTTTPINLLVVELKEFKGRKPEKPHLYIALTSLKTDVAFQRLNDGNGPTWLLGSIAKLRNDLIPDYRETHKRDVAEDRLEKLKRDLSRQGFGVNGDSKVWVVYVLDVDPDTEPIILDRGKNGKVIYVGQTSTTRELRTEQHAGRVLSKSGKHIGAPSTKGRNPVLNLRLSPTKELYTEDDAIAFESATNRRLVDLGYRVLGDSRKESDT